MIHILTHSLKPCVYSTDEYTDEERKTLCEGCTLLCKYNKTK